MMLVVLYYDGGGGLYPMVWWCAFGGMVVGDLFVTGIVPVCFIVLVLFC